MEIGVGERIEHGVTLQVAVTDERAPGVQAIDARVPKAELDLVAVAAFFDRNSRTRLHLGFVESYIAHEIGDYPELVLVEYRHAESDQDVDQLVVRGEREQVGRWVGVVADVEQGIALLQ